MSKNINEFQDGEHAYLPAGSVIYNVEDTSGENPPAENNGSWTAYWERKSGCALPKKCPVCGVNLNDANTAGAHIRLSSENDDLWAWIAILCDGCNNWQNASKMILEERADIVRIKMTNKHKTAKQLN